MLWPGLATAAAGLVALVVGGPAALVVVIGLGLQVAVTATRRPGVARGSRRLLVHVLPVTVGWLVIIVALDAAAGVVWNRLTGEDEDSITATVQLAAIDLPPTTDERIDSLAYDGVPWADRVLAELEHLDYDYLPFVGPRVAPVAGRYTNSAAGIRRSYHAPGTGDDEPEVWFFGGSTLWGEGQRDLHTIPSEVARLAEAAGVPIRVVNFGERGYTAYQEFLLFEQELAERGPPALAVFYDGQNELGTQQETFENLSEQPSIYQLAAVLDAQERAPALPGAQAPTEPSLATEYRESSAVHKLLRQLELIEPAGAQEAPEVAPLEDVLDNATDIYQRSVAMIRDLGARTGTPVLNFWQPGHRDDIVFLELADRAGRATGDVIDITDAYLGVPSDDLLFIDGGHTNEVGSRLSAEAMWPHLRPLVEDPAP